ncbi:28S ribosomal protein S18b, mitochondrial [Protopterus annectens]|uniref:28S ribosomal protein S18b, mitochondrial n=1 Tax=Protopterus annectens TaxID=7888 RepID=UPI001CFB7B52|nr:28S ribosomal protein S18b, mitochondrial [Protopterus annectens]
MANVVRLSMRVFALSTAQTVRCLRLGKAVAPGWYWRRPLSQSFCTATEQIEQTGFDTVSRYKERPWEYLESEEYIERYGERPVWSDYRRNHKGAIPPQKTRKMCIRGDKVSGNPCPICRDQKLQIDYRNVKLLQQFVSPYTGIILDATRTGVCRKQHKNLTKAIQTARECGLLQFSIPFTELKTEDYSNTHGAVVKTPPPPANQLQGPWYPWYDWLQPPAKEIAKMRKLYRKYLKEEVKHELS